jgi:acyl-CoA thioesterase FadM
VSATSNEVVAEGSAVVVSFDYSSSKKTPLPQPIRDRIYQLEQSAGELH